MCRVAGPHIETQGYPALLWDPRAEGPPGGTVHSLLQASVVNVVIVVVGSQLIRAVGAIDLAVVCIAGRLKAWRVRGVIRGGTTRVQSNGTKSWPIFGKKPARSLPPRACERPKQIRYSGSFNPLTLYGLGEMAYGAGGPLRDPLDLTLNQ
jgi:hypothetical protein